MKRWRWFLTQLSLREGDKIVVRYRGGRELRGIIKECSRDFLFLEYLNYSKKQKDQNRSIRIGEGINPLGANILWIRKLP